jgi:hypothetical protein
MCKENDITGHGADPCNQAIDPGADLFRAFPARTAVAENYPPDRPRADLFRR